MDFKKILNYFCISFLLLFYVVAIDLDLDLDSPKCVDNYQILKLILLKINNIIKLQPVHPNPKVHFHLYTRLNLIEKQHLIPNDLIGLDLSNFNTSWPTRFIISGWMNVHNSCSIITIRDAYLLKDNYNVITVSWDDKAVDIDYIYLSLTVDIIAKKLVEFTKFLNLKKFVNYSDMYLIGFSLGAHIAGSAGKLLYPNKYKTIFALEPAGPMFYGLGINRRVDSTDAEYVESIQTNIGVAGYFGEAGTASVFPNYGNNQPNCSLYATSCNHSAAYRYFAESILANNTNKQFIGVKCESFIKLTILNSCNCKYNNKTKCIYDRIGGDPALPKKGVYFLKTNKNYPFARGMEGLE